MLCCREFRPKLGVPTKDENGSDTNGYHRYHICFHISGWVRIQIRIILTISDKIQLNIDIINIQFKCLDTDTVSDVEYLDLDTDNSKTSLNEFCIEYGQKICVPFSSLVPTQVESSDTSRKI
jgi:hypothetical protein